MQRGLYLINSKCWGVHPAGTKIAPLTNLRQYLNDHLINKAKDIANKLCIREYHISYVDSYGTAVKLYSSE